MASLWPTSHNARYENGDVRVLVDYNDSLRSALYIELLKEASRKEPLIDSHSGVSGSVLATWLTFPAKLNDCFHKLTLT